MYCKEEFDYFLENKVNLNKTRINRATVSVDYIVKLIQNMDELREFFIKHSPQGSFKHKTVIKPINENSEFDIDVIVYFKKIQSIEPKDYINIIYSNLNENGNFYQVSRKTRCITIEYLNDYHIDIVPAVIDDQRILICNKKENTFEITDGDSYSDWLKEINSRVGNDYLIKSIRLFKYLRNIKQRFTVKSILLTTLLTNEAEKLLYNEIEKENKILFSDLPTTFNNLFRSLKDFLDNNNTMPIIINPVLESEDFNRHWNEKKYQNFKTEIYRYSNWSQEAFDSNELVDAIEAWGKLFGDDFPTRPISAIKIALDKYKYVNHYRKHTWMTISKNIIGINASLHMSENGMMVRKLSNNETVAKGNHIKYEIVSIFNYNEVEIYWQVVNTGEEAKNDLRGNIEKYNKPVKWESTRYKGTHWIECYIVINKKLCVRSMQFFINVI